MASEQWLFGPASGAGRSAVMAVNPNWVTLHAIADLMIAIGFFVVAAALAFYIIRRPGAYRRYTREAILFGSFLLVAGITHLAAVMTLWYPAFGLEGLAKSLMAVLAGAAAGLIWPQLPAIVREPSAHELGVVNERLRREAEAHEVTLRELADAGRELEGRVEERTRELRLVNARFETALRGSQVYLFSQDRDLRFVWVFSPNEEEAASAMIGRTDAEILPAPERDALIAAKRKVLETGLPADIEVASVLPERRALYSMRIDPTFAADRSVDGITCAAIDISRIRSLESEQRRLTEALGTTLQRYETALRGSNVTVYTQDRDLRVTSLSSPIFGLDIEDVLGRPEQDVLPADARQPMVALKQEVLETGQARSGTIKVTEAAGERWHEIHVEALRDAGGAIVGVTSAAVDVSGSKANESHLRDLMREITHRSKNLLAVIQAMARQTARHSGSTETFLEQFGSRLQALSASHDLLVQEGWHGASFGELVHAQVAKDAAGRTARITIDGPPVLLKPEAAQTLGLALHELMSNATRHGALSVPEGTVSIIWRRAPADAVELTWSESGGPAVAAPTRRGFGLLVIERNLQRTLEAEIDLQFLPEGLRCRVMIPADQMAS